MSPKTSSAHAVTKAVIILLLLFCFVCVPTGSTQISPGQKTPAEIEMEEQQKHAAEKAVNAKRQQDIKKDTDKLMELATELKQYVDKTNENTMSVDVIKKAEEIEKLAHTVREKMKGQ